MSGEPKGKVTNKVEFLKAVAPIIVGILGFFASAVISSVIIHPNFEIEKVGEISNNTEHFKITNVGWVQAKKVEIIFLSNDLFKLENIDCNEYNDTYDNTSKMKIILNLDRMSTNLDCDVDANVNSSISKIIVTASDSPPKVWPDEKHEAPYLFNIVLAIAGAVITRILQHLLETKKKKENKMKTDEQEKKKDEFEKIAQATQERKVTNDLLNYFKMRFEDKTYDMFDPTKHATGFTGDKTSENTGSFFKKMQQTELSDPIYPKDDDEESNK